MHQYNQRKHHYELEITFHSGIFFAGNFPIKNSLQETHEHEVTSNCQVKLHLYAQRLMRKIDKMTNSPQQVLAYILKQFKLIKLPAANEFQH